MAAPTFVILEKTAWAAMQQQFTLYQTAVVLMIFGLIGILYLFHPAFPFLWSKFIHKNITVGILNSNHMIELSTAFTKKDGKYFYNKKPLDFVKVYEGSFFFANYIFDLLTIELRELDNPKYWIMCDKARKLGYKNIDMLERALQFSMLSENNPMLAEILEKGKFNSVEDAAAALNPGNINQHHPLIKYFFESIPLASLIGYGNEIPPEDITGEVDDIYESRKPQNAMMKKMMKVLPMAVLVVAFAIIAAVLYKIFFAVPK